MPRHFITELKYLSPSISPDPEGDPPAGGGGGGPTTEELQAALDNLQSELSAKNSIIDKLRPTERKYQQVSQILGEVSPEKLAELRDAERRLEEQQAKQDQLVLGIKQEAQTEWQEQVDGLQKSNKALTLEVAKVNQKFDLFRAFNNNGGIGARFDGFESLAGKNFERNKTSGALQVRDDQKRLVTFKDAEGERPATAEEFIQMLGQGDLGEYKFSQLDLIKLTLEPAKKSSGVDMPGNSGYNRTKPLNEMTQTELAKAAGWG